MSDNPVDRLHRFAVRLREEELTRLRISTVLLGILLGILLSVVLPGWAIMVFAVLVLSGLLWMMQP